MVEIRQLTDKSELNSIQKFLSRATGRPFAYHLDVPDSKLGACLKSSIAPFAEPNDEKGCHIAYAGGEPKAILCWQRLGWDSDIFGFGAGKIGPVLYEGGDAQLRDIMGVLLDKSLAKLSAIGVRHITARILSNQLVAVHAMEDRGFQLIDSILLFAFDFRHQELLELAHPFQILPTKAEHHEGIMDVAQRSFIYDRFHSDPYISKENADKLHRMWLRNLLNSDDAGVLAAVDGSEVIGFTAGKLLEEESKQLGLKLGVWILMAAMQDQRKKGLGRALTYEMLRHYSTLCDVFEGGTQSTNTPSARAFLGAGYKYVSSSFSMRRWLA